MKTRILRPALVALAALTLPGWLAGCASMQSGMMKMMPTSMKNDMMAKTTAKMQKLAPARGYLDAHQSQTRPHDLLGGPLSIKLSQTSGGVFVALPDHRKLDPAVFGTPDDPRAFGGTPGINGLPVMGREQSGGAFTQTRKLTPFGDKHTVMADGRLQIEALDATATDAATTKDWVHMKASWKDKAGNTYSVRCCKMVAAHGVEYPTFGGVVTNHILHGFSRIGTALMPSEYTYFAFWGMGQVEKNGKVLDKPRLIHGMLTEYVRTAGYRLAMDSQVSPGQLQFHLMVPPMKPVMSEGRFEHSPVKTGMTLPNGKPLPFWHVMFESVQVDGHHV